MPDVYITGANGFVGRNLSGYLAKESIEAVAVQLRDPSAVLFPEPAGAVVHLAGKAHDIKNVAAPEAYYDTNFGLTKKLYDAFLVSDIRKFIFISSVKAAADHIDSVLTEEHTAAPLTHYGKSKLMAEEYILKTPLPAGKSFYILRPCMIHGPGNKGNLNLLYKIIEKGFPYPLAAFENRRSFLSIENLCFIIMQLLQNDHVPSGIYNVSDDEALSTNELVGIIAKELSRKARLFKINKSFIRTVAATGDVLRLPLNTEKLNKLTENYIVSNKKITAAIGKSLPVSAAEGLRTTIRSFIGQK